jgi:hypothetical protein
VKFQNSIPSGKQNTNALPTKLHKLQHPVDKADFLNLD